MSFEDKFRNLVGTDQRDEKTVMRDLVDIQREIDSFFGIKTELKFKQVWFRGDPTSIDRPEYRAILSWTFWGHNGGTILAVSLSAYPVKIYCDYPVDIRGQSCADKNDLEDAIARIFSSGQLHFMTSNYKEFKDACLKEGDT